LRRSESSQAFGEPSFGKRPDPAVTNSDRIDQCQALGQARITPGDLGRLVVKRLERNTTGFAASVGPHGRRFVDRARGLR
jgi:hypothetical protein